MNMLNSMERGADSPPVDMLAALFEARGWTAERVNEEELSGEIQGQLGEIPDPLHLAQRG